MVKSKDSYAGLILYPLRTTLYLLGTAVRHSLLRFSLRQSEELGRGLADEWAGGQGSRETFKPRNTKRGKCHCTIDLLFDWF
jgi:hypothetical protein